MLSPLCTSNIVPPVVNRHQADKSWILCRNPNITPLIVAGAPGQVNDLFQIKNSSGTVLLTTTAAGNVGIGSTSPLGKLDVRATSGSQGVFSYDSSNYWSIAVGSAGSTTFDLTGTTPLFTFGKAVIIGGTTDPTNGQDAIYSRGTKFLAIGSKFSTGYSFLGYGLKANTSTGYLSSLSNNTGRSAVEVGSNLILFWMGPVQTSTDGGSVTVAEAARFDVNNNFLVGVQANSTLGRFESRVTSGAQIAGSYDGSNYWTATTNSVGKTTFAGVGSSAAFSITTATTFSAGCLISSPAPTAPGSVAVSFSAPYTSASISWANINGAATYNIFRSTGVNGPWGTAIGSNSGTPYSDTGGTAGTQYYYIVTASSSSGDTGPYSASVGGKWPVYYDTFTDTSGTALTSHTADIDATGNAWVNSYGTSKISASNTLIANTVALAPWGGGTAFSSALKNFARADFTLQASFSFTSIGSVLPGICFRCTDKDNGLVFNIGASTITLYTLVSGTASSQATGSISAVSGQNVKVVCSGTSVTISYNGVAVITYTDSTYNAKTNHGFFLYNSNGYAFDNYLVQ